MTRKIMHKLLFTVRTTITWHYTYLVDINSFLWHILSYLPCEESISSRHHERSKYPCWPFLRSGQSLGAGCQIGPCRLSFYRDAPASLPFVQSTLRFSWLYLRCRIQWASKKRVVSKTAVRPNHLPINTHAVQRSLSQWLDAPSRAGQRMAHAAAVANV